MGPVETMLDIYLVENTKLLETLEELMLDSEREDNLSHEQIDEIFRTMHTIKGSSAMMGYTGLTTLTHSMEDIFAVLRQNGTVPQEIKSDLFELVLQCVDFMKNEMETIASGLMPDGEIAPLHKRAVALLGQISPKAEEPKKPDTIVMPADKPAAPAAPVAAPAPDASEPSVVFAPEILAAQPDGGASPAGHVYYGRIFFEADCSMESIRAFAVANTLKEFCKKIVTLPDNLDVNNDDYIIANGFTLYILSEEESQFIHDKLEETMFLRSLEFNVITPDAMPAELRAKLFEGVEQVSAPAAAPAVAAAPVAAAPAAPVEAAVEVAAPAAPAAEQHAPEAAEADHKDAPKQNANGAVSGGGAQSYLSVNITKVDKLMDLVGEIVTSESMVIENPDILQVKSKTFEKQSRRLRQLTDELRDIVISVRMVPISTTFRKMERIVRDMCKSTGKKAVLIQNGGQTEIDKKVAESLSDPLMHMIRNSMDHGIESPEERKRVGKPETGTVTLEARNTGSDITITVQDDGGGLDKEAIVRKARERGLTNKTVDAISDHDAFAFIMMAGFSTNKEVTEYSGRGVGMDVVHQNLTQIGGSINIDSVKGQGTTFTLHIPMTLAIISGMHVQVGKEQYILPIQNIRESFKPQTKDIVIEPDGSESIMVHDRCCRVKRLHQMFSVDNAITKLEDAVAILIESENDAHCLLVDRIVGEQQAVVKPIPAFINRIVGRLPNISGCTILGNGSICLILD